MQPTLVFLPGESSGHRSVVGYSPCSHKELDMTECICHLDSFLPQSSGGATVIQALRV